VIGSFQDAYDPRKVIWGGDYLSTGIPFRPREMTAADLGLPERGPKSNLTYEHAKEVLRGFGIFIRENTSHEWHLRQLLAPAPPPPRL
jgi:hypothetical protein